MIVLQSSNTSICHCKVGIDTHRLGMLYQSYPSIPISCNGIACAARVSAQVQRRRSQQETLIKQTHDIHFITSSAMSKELTLVCPAGGSPACRIEHMEHQASYNQHRPALSVKRHAALPENLWKVICVAACSFQAFECRKHSCSNGCTHGPAA